MKLTDRIQVFNEDCMVGMARYPDKYFDLAIVDPPYGIDISKSPRITEINNLKKKEWDNCTPDGSYFTELFRISKNCIIWGGNYFNLPPTKCFVIWDKKQPEGISFASCEFAWTDFDKVAKTFYMSPMSKETRIHPTQKPIALYKWLLHNYSEPGQKIIDTHLGSGSSAIAAHQFGISEFVAYELDEDYFKSFVERFKKETAQDMLFNTNGNIAIKDQEIFE